MDNVRLGLILEGSACWRINETEYPVGPGDAVLVLPGAQRTAYGVTSFRQASAQLRWASANSSPLEPMDKIPDWLLLPARVHVGIDGVAELLSLLRHAFAETELQQPGYEEMVDAYLRQILIRLYRLAEAQQTKSETHVVFSGPGGTAGRSTPLNQALQFIHLHLNEPIYIGDVALACGYSESHLRRLFREHIGLTPTEYVTRARIQRARRLLQIGQFSVAEVSAEVGFADPYHFSRTFKSVVGLSPREFLKKQNPLK